MEENLRRFTIDDYLKLYTKALESLSKCAPRKTFDDVLAYVKRHNLHRNAMQLYKDNKEQYDVSSLESQLTQLILGSYAGYLLENKLPAEAGLAYEMVGQLPKALESYTKALMWRESLNVAYAMSLSRHEIAELTTRLADSLLERREFVDAARLYIDYATDTTAIENAVKALVKGYHFSEAIRIVCPWRILLT
jgi:elongator complex protein 1